MVIVFIRPTDSFVISNLSPCDIFHVECCGVVDWACSIRTDCCNVRISFDSQFVFVCRVSIFPIADETAAIISYVTQGDGKGVFWDDLAWWTDTYWNRLCGSPQLEESIGRLLK